MWKLISPNKCRLIAMTLIFVFIFLMIFPLTTGVAEAATGSLFSENTTIIKGLAIIILAFLLDNVIGDQTVDLKPGNPDITIIPENNRPYTETRYLAKGEKEVLGFYVNWGTESYPALTRNQRNIDMVSPFWYTITSNGELTTKYNGPQAQVSSFSRQNGQLLIPLINNDRTNSAMLTNANLRQRSIEAIVALVQRNNYAGINIDFEYIPPWTKDGYTTFIRELSKKLHARGKQLHISVFPKVGVPEEMHGAYDYKALAPYIDRFIIMTYDNHWATGPAGPIAPINWVEDNIRYALRYVPADKILLGIANYGYDWPTNGRGRDIASKKAIELAAQKGVRIQWDSENKVPYFIYYDSKGIKRQVWFENSYSLDLKLNLVNKYNLQGIAIWRLGNEEDRFWDIVVDRLNK